MYFYINEFEVGINDRIFSGNEQQQVQLLQPQAQHQTSAAANSLRL